MARHRRRSLTNVGGRARLSGDPELARALAHCLDVDPTARLPFTHGFHAYPARMHPETARRALERFAPTRLIDPFVGSGTTALEAVRAGLPFTGTDISRVAIEIAWARTRVWVPEDCRRVERDGARIASAARHERRPPPPWPDAEWFSPHTLAEIGALKTLIDAVGVADVRRILLVVLSSLLVKLSRQASDSTTAFDRGKRAWPPGATHRLFADKCSELTKDLLLLSSDLHKRGIRPPQPELRVDDARTARFEPADLALTSPPYPGTYDYARHHRLRFPLFAEDRDFAERHEIGARRDFDPARYRDDLRAALANLPARRVLVLIGDGRGVRTDRLLREIAPVAAVASQERVEWAHGRRGQRKREHLVLIERAAR